jgi:acetyl/propionyl-CoA carboxylase alpha subunit
MGMAVVNRPADMAAEFEKVTGFAGRLFGDPSVFIERYFPRVRHVEVQILGLADGTVLALGERDCSVQRRNQKVVEETPSPALDGPLRQRMVAAARLAGEVVHYQGAGTVEFLLSPATPDKPAEFFFLEMNTRLQVEHPITEAVLGIDLVRAQLLMAKVIVHGSDRANALRLARMAVAGFTIVGPKSNLAFHAELLSYPEFATGDYDTGIVGRMRAWLRLLRRRSQAQSTSDGGGGVCRSGPAWVGSFWTADVHLR